MPVGPKIGFQAPIFVSPEPPATTPPVVVSGFLARPLQVHLANPRPRSLLSGQARIYPPAVVLPDIPLAGDGKRTLKIRLARAIPLAARFTRSRISPPAVVLPDIPLAGDGKRRLRIYLARAVPFEARRSRSRIAPPAVVNPPAAAPPSPPLQVHLAQPRPRSLQAGRARVFPPTVLAPLPVDAKLRVYLARFVPRLLTRSRLSPPIIPAAAAQPPRTEKLSVNLAHAIPRAARFTRSRISPPAVVNPPLPVETVLKVYRAGGRETLLRRPGHSSQTRPTVVILPPVETVLKVYRAGGRETYLRRPGRSSLRAPTVVNAPIQNPPVVTKLRIYLSPVNEYEFIRRHAPAAFNLGPAPIVPAVSDSGARHPHMISTHG